MNGYLSTLASRVVERAQPVTPRVASLFEPLTAPRIPLAEPSKRNARARTTPQRAAEPRGMSRPPATEQTHSTVTSSAISPVTPVEPSPQSIGAIAQARTTGTARIETSESIRELSLPRDVSSKTEKPDEITFQAAAHRGEPLSPLVRTATVLERTVVSERPITTIVMPASEPASKSDQRSEQHHGAQVIVRPEVKTSHDAPEPIAAPEIVREGAPAIRITIGRVDVRAIMPQAQPSAAASSLQHPQRNSALGLDDYLKKRNGALK